MSYPTRASMYPSQFKELIRLVGAEGKRITLPLKRNEEGKCHDAMRTQARFYAMKRALRASSNPEDKSLGAFADCVIASINKEDGSLTFHNRDKTPEALLLEAAIQEAIDEDTP